jgi:hypothetical protein
MLNDNKNNLEYDDDTLDTEGQYVDIDDDSNTQHSIGQMNSRASFLNSNRPQTAVVPTATSNVDGRCCNILLHNKYENR